MAASLIASLTFGQTILIRYVESTLFALGITGSALNTLLFAQRKLRTNSCCTYFLALSIVAIVMLLVTLIPQFYAVDHSPDPVFNQGYCKGQGYIAQSTGMLCRWLLTIACIDRCLLTSTNARFRLFSTVKLARKMILLLTIIWLVIPIHILIFADVRRLGYPICIMSTDGSVLYHAIYTIIAGGLLPSLIMLICTKIIWKSLQLKRERQRTTILHRRKNRQEKQDVQVLIMLLFQAITFLIFTLPSMSFNLYIAATRSVTNKSIDRQALEAFVQLVTQVAIYVSPVTAFFSNILASQTFRNELFILFWRIFTCGSKERFRAARNRLGPSTITATVTKRNDIVMTTVN